MIGIPPIIHDRAIIAEPENDYRPVGEAAGAAYFQQNPMLLQEHQDMLARLNHTILNLMEEAKATHEADNQKYHDPDRITRLSTNEFFFYTKAPLTIKEFEQIQNKIAEKAKTISSGVQLILGSFAVKTDAGEVMNVVPHIVCGNPPHVHLIVKNHTSSIDVRYKESDGFGNLDTLPVLDSETYNPSLSMPQIIIDGKSIHFTFNNIVPCKTTGGSPFLTVVDICLDHHYGLGKKNYNALLEKKPQLSTQPVSHVIVSNWIALSKKNCIGTAVMHVDPRFSPLACKQKITQHRSASSKKEFGDNLVNTFDVEAEILGYHINNNYAYKAEKPWGNRNWGAREAHYDRTRYQKPVSSSEFEQFKSKYETLRGDHLKSKILENLQKQIECIRTKEELTKFKKELKKSYEMDILKSGQGWFTQTFGTKTSSQKALEDMLNQHEKYLSDINDKLSN